jgi:hypothetical protein
MAETVVLYDGPIVSREEAVKSGAKRFFDGRVCKYGHVAQHHVSNYSCIECSNERSRVLQKNHPEVRRAAVHRWLAVPENREKARVRDRERKRKVYADNPDGFKRRNRERKQVRLESRAGRAKPKCCDVCGQSGFGAETAGRSRKIVFDHCHKDGHFRGWLCDRCNTVLGRVNDDVSLLVKLAEYLENSDGGAVSETEARVAEVEFCASR